MKIMIKPAIKIFLIITILCGIVYPLVVTGFAQLFFPEKANGEITLIGQNFTDVRYLIGRPTEGINLSPVSKEAQALVNDRRDFLENLDPTNDKEIPKDLLMSSGSGVDPNISVKAAEYQIERIARGRDLSKEQVTNIINKNINERFLGIFGERTVNVLKVNISLDELK